MKDRPLLSKILGKAPWSVWRGIDSSLVFEFGPRRAHGKGRPQGTYTLQVFMGHWHIGRNGKELAHAESPDQTINRAANALQGKQLRALVLETFMTKDAVTHFARLCFDKGYSSYAFIYDDHEPDSIFRLYSPTQVLYFDCQGRLLARKVRNGRTRHMLAPQ